MRREALGKLHRVPIRDVWKDEAKDFSVWLEQNVGALCEALGFDIEITEREHQVGTFSLDLLGVTPQGEKVVIENQLAKTDHTHLGQVLTYLTNLQAKVAVWIASDPRQEHVNVINWLNEQTDCRFYLVRLEAIAIDDSNPAPLFSVICEPDDDLKAVATHNKELTDRGKFNLNLWSEVVAHCQSVLPQFAGRKPSKYHFFGGSSGKGGLSFTFLATSGFYGVELYIDVQDADQNELILKSLMKDQRAIEAEFGHKFDWELLEEKRACRVRFKIAEEDAMQVDFKKLVSSLVDTMAKFERVFRPRIKALSVRAEAA